MKSTTSLALLFLAWSITTQAQELPPADGCNCCDGSCSKWGAILDAQYKPGSRAFWGGDLMLPVMQEETSLLMLYARGLFDEDGWYAPGDTQEFNIGAVFRRQVDCDHILGAYAFYDTKTSEFDNQFHGCAVGVESLSAQFDARINGYLTGDDVEEITELNQAVLVDDNLFVRQGLEGAYHGFDAEAGTLLYQFGHNCLNEVRGYAGGYYFDGPTGSFDEITGPKLRLEARFYDLPRLGVGSRLTLGAEYRYDDERESEGFFVARLQIPIGALARRALPCLPDTCSRLSYLDRRMLDPVIRDDDIITNATRGPLENAINLECGETISGVAFVRAGDDAESITEGAGEDSLVIFDGTDGQIDVASGRRQRIGGRRRRLRRRGHLYRARCPPDYCQ
jgi:hypothetical protein